MGIEREGAGAMPDKIERRLNRAVRKLGRPLTEADLDAILAEENERDAARRRSRRLKQLRTLFEGGSGYF